MKNNKKKYFVIFGFALVALLGVSYALFSMTLIGQKKYTVKSGGLRIYLDESATSESISLENAIPVTDDEGMENTPYNFSLVNEEDEDLEYTIYLKEDEYANKTPSSAIRYYYTRDVENIEITRNMEDSKTEDGRFYLESGIIPGKNTYNYTFRMWINYEAGNEVLNTEYSIHLEIDAKQTISIYKEVALNGTDPVLSDNLIPIKIANDGTVTKASLYKEWYNYEKQEWANAVVLVDNTIKYKVGETIPESNIESYFVWIPRFKYKIFNDGNYTKLTGVENRVQTIEVEFENKDTTPSNGTAVGQWLSHPAFQAFDSNGFWVGKFESGYNGATTTEAAQVNSNDSSKLIIKPNVYSWRNITLGNAFDLTYNYLREDESHMMKNTEWGAVAYLQHSIYGSRKSVKINNNNSYLTGYAAVTEPTCGYSNGTSTSCNQIGTDASVTLPYNTEIGYTATTTNNITGIYDMSGGAHEYVMGYNTSASTVGGKSEITGIYGDFFTNSAWEKYYDKYSANVQTEFNTRILGDATGEMGPFGNIEDPDGISRARNSWYGDYGYYIRTNAPWFTRGGPWNLGVEAGIFNFNAHTGEVYGLTFRVVLTPQ